MHSLEVIITGTIIVVLVFDYLDLLLWQRTTVCNHEHGTDDKQGQFHFGSFAAQSLLLQENAQESDSNININNQWVWSMGIKKEANQQKQEQQE